MARPTVSEETFEACRDRFGHLSLDTIEVAREVLVEGRRNVDVATDRGMSKQRVQAMIKRVMTAVEAVPGDWQRVEVWLPPGMAKEVRKLADKERERLKKEGK